MERKEEKGKMQIFHHGKTREEGFVMLRALVLSVSVMMIISALMCIFGSFILNAKNNMVDELKIIEIENLRVENEIN